MPYRLLALGAFWLHSMLSLWIFAGAIAELFYPRYVPYHVLLLCLTLLCQWACAWQCPLTAFEKAMLARCAPENVYEGAFLRHYVKKYFGMTIPPRRIVQSLVAIFAGSIILWGINASFGI